MGFEMAGKIMKIESKVKENESQDTSTTMEASRKNETVENVNNEQKTTKDPKEKRQRNKFQFLGLELKLATLYQLKLNLRLKENEQKNSNVNSLVFYQLCHLSLVIPVMSLAIPGLSLAIPGLSLLVPSQFQDVPDSFCLTFNQQYINS